jgi:2-C-methyl-D-erythritol 4-phosphate cytidylyltransferase
MRSAGRQWWLVMPAAGRSRRMADVELPKQYLELLGRSVIEWALAPFLAHRDCAGVVVALSTEDTHWDKLAAATDRRVTTVTGGAERVDSVRAALAALSKRADDGDWVLVHDAARPCLPAADLERLLATLWDDSIGGLLAAPVVDTLKRADEAGRVDQTVARESLWHALTPQMFRYGPLVRALDTAAASGRPVTDEAQAIEGLGLRPRLVLGSSDNLKVTIASDLERARRVLAAALANMSDTT